MPSQVLSAQSSAVRSFTALVRAQASATRRLSAQLSADHGLTISDYEVLLRLARAQIAECGASTSPIRSS